MKDPITFVVTGRFGTKGSARLVKTPRTGRTFMKASSKFLAQWTADCRYAAHLARVKKLPGDVGVHIVVTYEFTRPQRCPRETPCIKPDVDKLARALLDALTGLAYVDDGQVVKLEVEKIYGRGNTAHVTIGRW